MEVQVDGIDVGARRQILCDLSFMMNMICHACNVSLKLLLYYANEN